MSILFVGGGSRSGKSRYALELARSRFGSKRYFLATAEPLDGEMVDRIERHREERGSEFVTIEEPREIDRAILALQGSADVIVVDCLTLWISNMMFAERDAEIYDRLARIEACPVPCILVTNEVGSGIVPENALARRFRDLAGSVNQRAAALATEAYFMAFGIAMRLK
jgi:adenosylcobinamide kinase / adenosylcobinamide-phosphate guanylyltransferase